MNILHISTYLQGGAGRIISELIIASKKLGDSCTLLLTQDENDGYTSYQEYIDRLLEHGISIEYVDSIFKRNLRKNLNAAEKVSQLISSNDIEIIHSHTAISSYVGLIGRSLSRCHVPIIQTMHGWGNNKTEEQTNTDISILNNIELVVPISKSAGQLLHQLNLKNKHLKTIYNGVKQPAKLKVEVHQTLLNDIMQKAAKVPIIGCIGTICERKNQQCLVDAVNKLITKHNMSVHLVLIGECGDSNGEVNLNIPSTMIDYVTITGYLDSPNRLMSTLDCVVSTSNSEGGIELALLEAMQANVPTVVSDTPEHLELYKHSENGLVFEANNSDSLVTQLMNLFDMPKSQAANITSNAHHVFQERFTFTRMIEEYRLSYTQLVNESYLNR